MDAAKPGHSVEFHGLQGAAHLNGTQGTVVKWLKKEQRWEVRCELDNQKVNAKPTNLILIRNSSRPIIGGDFTPAQAKRYFGEAATRATSTDTDPSAWAKGLSKVDQYEWFSNCYQMRCDDDYAYGGCNLHGPYNPEATPQTIADDFLVYCLLAKRSRSIPTNWDWSAFLKVAANHVAFAFEKSDAQERWGSENVFNAQMGGGRSLRYTGIGIYGSGVETDEDSPEHQAAEEEMRSNKRTVQEQVGGIQTWANFVNDLGRCNRFA